MPHEGASQCGKHCRVDSVFGAAAFARRPVFDRLLCRLEWARLLRLQFWHSCGWSRLCDGSPGTHLCERSAGGPWCCLLFAPPRCATRHWRAAVFGCLDSPGRWPVFGLLHSHRAPVTKTQRIGAAVRWLLFPFFLMVLVFGRARVDLLLTTVGPPVFLLRPLFHSIRRRDDCGGYGSGAARLG